MQGHARRWLKETGSVGQRVYLEFEPHAVRSCVIDPYARRDTRKLDHEGNMGLWQAPDANHKACVGRQGASWIRTFR